MTALRGESNSCWIRAGARKWRNWSRRVLRRARSLSSSLAIASFETMLKPASRSRIRSRPSRKPLVITPNASSPGFAGNRTSSGSPVLVMHPRYFRQLWITCNRCWRNFRMPRGGRTSATRYNYYGGRFPEELGGLSSVGFSGIESARTYFPCMKAPRATDVRERALLVGLGLKRAPHVPGHSSDETARESLQELAELARSAGAIVAGSILQMRE